MKKSDISNISNAESVERAEESVRSSVQPSGKFGGKADRLFGADPAGLDESARGIAVLVIVGVAVGLLSGMFGIGGGTVIVQNMTVGKESDIRGVAQELYRLGQRAARVEGTVYA